jgi:eukaryotic-like serine/threonine-protein kinase
LARDSVDGQCPSCLFQLGLAPSQESEKSSKDSSPSRQHLGNYRLLAELARGGMGIVYRARQEGLEREVALKVLREGSLASREAVQRFQTEVQAAARLDHPNIVPIYEVGQDGGQHFFTMRLLAGGSLAALLSAREGKPLPAQQAAQLLIAVARAVDCAHRRGILHRDLKPGNILLDADGSPQVADFGLARVLDADSSLTLPEAVLGSPAYMAPEQASGRSREATPAADIYSLGAILFELLTGQPPFTGARPLDILRRVADEPPPRPCALNPKTPSDLETICLKCLEKEPAQRYASAAALAEDLARWQRGEPIQARPSTLGERMVKWAKRRPLIAALSAGLIAVGVVGLIGVLLEWQRARAGEHVALLNQYAADMALANQSLSAGNSGRARTSLEQHRPRPGQPDLRGWEWYHFSAEANHSDALATLGRHGTRIVWVSFSPDSHWLASADLSGELSLWDLRTRQLAAQAHQPPWPSSLQFTPDGHFLITSQGGGDAPKCQVHWWLVPSLQESRPPLEAANLIDALPSPDGRQLFVLRGDGLDRLTPDGNSVLLAAPTLRTHAPSGFGAFSPDGSLFAYEANDGLVVWNLADNTTRVFAGHQRRTGFPFSISGLAFALDDSVLATCGPDGTVRIWPLRSNVPQDSVRELADTGGVISQVAFVRGGQWLAGASTDQTIHLWDARTWQPAGQLRGHGSAVVALAASPDGALLASGAMDGEIKLWSAAPPTASQTAVALPAYVQSFDDLALAPDGSYLLTRNRQTQTFQLWNTATLNPETNTFAPPTGFQGWAAVGPDARWLVFAGTQGTQVVLRNRLATTRTLTNSWIRALSQDGRLMLSVAQPRAGQHWVAQVLEAGSGVELAHADIGWHSVMMGFAISQDGRWIALGFLGGEVRVWNWRTQQHLELDPGQSAPTAGLAFSPDNRQLAAVSYNSLARVYDLPDGSERYSLNTFSLHLDSVAWSPDGRRLVIGASDGTARIWALDATPPREIAVLPGHTNSVDAAAFTADGNTLVTVSSDSLRVWRTDQAPR